MIKTIQTTLALSLILVSTSIACAQDEAPLRGPSVEPVERRSLVPSGMMGGMTDAVGELNQRPEIAAIDLLELDEEARERVNGVLLEHISATDTFFMDHLGQIQGWVAAVQAGTLRERLGALREIKVAYEPVEALGPIADRIKAAIPSEQAERYEALIAEYEQARESEARRKAEASGVKFEPIGYKITRHFEKLGQDIAASYERTLVSGGEDFEAFLSSAQLSNQGEAKVRRAVMDLVERTGFKPTPEQRLEAFMQVMGELDPDDRGKLLRAVLKDS